MIPLPMPFHHLFVNMLMSSNRSSSFNRSLSCVTWASFDSHHQTKNSPFNGSENGQKTKKRNLKVETIDNYNHLSHISDHVFLPQLTRPPCLVYSACNINNSPLKIVTRTNPSKVVVGVSRRLSSDRLQAIIYNRLINSYWSWYVIRPAFGGEPRNIKHAACTASAKT